MSGSFQELDNFKRTLSQFEKTVQQDSNSDIKVEIDRFLTWIPYVQEPNNVPPEAEEHFYCDVLPKFTQTILKRRYNNDEQILKVQNFLEVVASSIPAAIAREYEGVAVVIKDLLDPNQHFYKKYGYPRIDSSKASFAGKISSQVVTFDEEFIKSISQPQACFDCKSDTGVWNVVIVEQVSSMETELEIVWQSSEKKEWISIESYYHRMAPAFSKSMEGSEDPTSVSNPIAEPIPEPVEDVGAIDNGTSAWKYNLTVGNMVDVKFTDNLWYQAVILDIQNVEDTSALPIMLDHDPIRAIVLPKSPMPRVSCDDDKSMTLERVNFMENDASSLNDECESIDSLAVNADVSPPRKFAANELDGQISTFGVDPTQPSTPSTCSVTSMEGCDDDKLQFPASFCSPTKFFKLTARVSYIGFPEKDGRWILVDSDQIDILNSKSNGRRGDNPIREEVYFLVKNIPTQDEHDLKCVLRDSCFLSPAFCNVANSFGKSNGFKRIVDFLGSGKRVENGAVLFPNIIYCLNLTIAVGTASPVFSVALINSLMKMFSGTSYHRIYLMTMPEIRMVPTELIEAALKAMEQFAISFHGRRSDAAINATEAIWLEISTRLIVCPFLNRRHGGLKLLNELIHRGLSAIECPTGIRATKVSLDQKDITVGLDYYLSFKVYPILYSVTLQTICETIIAKNLIYQIYAGDDAHDSLMSRAGDILHALVVTNLLSEDVLNVIWNAAFFKRSAEAMKALIDLMPLVSSEVMRPIVDKVGEIDPTLLTNEVVDVLSSIALRTRDILFSTAIIDANDSTLDLHEKVLRLLWLFATENSNVPNSVATNCQGKLEVALSTGHPVNSQDDIDKIPNFPWETHWIRSRYISEQAASSAKSQSLSYLVPGLKILQAYIASWPVKSVALDLAAASKSVFPFLVLSRGEIVNYLEVSFQIMSSVTMAIVHLKSQAVHFLSQLESDMAQIDSQKLSSDQQAKINSAKLGGSRLGYKEQLSHLLDFLMTYAQNGTESMPSGALELSWISIQSIWSTIVLQALTTAEVDCVLIFMRRLLGQLPKRIPRSTPTSSAKKMICSVQTLSHIFKELFFKESFIRSPYFTDLAYRCTEKLFMLLNSYSDNLLEVIKPDKSISFTLLKPLSETISWKIFLTVALLCDDESVALVAIKTLASLPQRLSLQMQTSGEMASVRKLLLNQFMAELRNITGVKQPSDSGDGESYTLQALKLRRCLVMLMNLLDESHYDSKSRIRPHGVLSRGSSISFKLNASKGLAQFNGKIFTLFLNDSVDDLIDQVENLVVRKLSDIRIMHRAKEIYAGDRKKLISHLGNLGEFETLMIIERVSNDLPSKTSASFSSAAAPSTSETKLDDEVESELTICTDVASKPNLQTTIISKEVALTELPAQMIVQNAEYFGLLFNILENSCDPNICDSVWQLLSRLPTSPDALNQWLFLEQNTGVTSVTELLYSSCGIAHVEDTLSATLVESLSLARLLYHLQIIEFLLQPVDTLSQWELLKTSNPHHDIPIDVIEEWPEIFVNYGGYSSILAVLHLLSRFAENLVANSGGSASFTRKGFSVNILLATTSLGSKLTRSVLLHSFQESQLDFVVRLSSKPPNGQSAVGDTINSSEVAPVFGPQLPSSPPPAPPSINISNDIFSSDAKENLSPDLPSNNSKEDSALVVNKSNEKNGEWGWRLFITSDVIRNSINQEIETATIIQKAVLSLMSSLRLLGGNVYFALDTDNCSISERLLIQSRHDTVLSILDNLLTIWSCEIVMQPQIIYKLRIPDIEKFSRQLLLGIFWSSSDRDARDLICRIDSKIEGGVNALGARIAKWTVHSIDQIANQISGIETMVDDDLLGLSESDERLSVYFKRTFLIALLQLRPQLADPIKSHNSSLTYPPLFSLLSKLLETKVGVETDHWLDDFHRSEICDEIFADLKRGSEGPHAQNIQHIGGLLGLLAALCRGRNEVLLFLYNKKLLVFLLEQCLGLMSVSSSINVPVLPLCRDNESCRGAYEVISALCDWHHGILAETLLYFQPIHRAVPTSNVWLYDPMSEERSSSGYVGLKNLGCTCYMNSVLQILFMNSTIRDFFVQLPAVEYSDIEGMRNDMALQMQKVFLSLNLSERKAHLPEDWVYSYKDSDTGLPILPNLQQDAQEFLQVMCDRIETTLDNREKVRLLRSSDSPGSPQSNLSNGTARNTDIFHRAFGGTLCDQMVSNSTGDIRERKENFVCISVDVKGSNSLEQSLHKFIAGEMIPDYLWEEGQPRVTITKRQCISDMSNSLIFHFKRFELNFDTFTRVRVNDYFPFPELLDMFPYSREGVMSSSQATGGSSGGAYYQYRLKAIVVHTGTADSGHYYSYIKDSDGKWFEFNDSTVKEFAEANIPNECYGGSTTSHDFDLSSNTLVNKEIVSQKSAYLVVYDRVAPVMDTTASLLLPESTLDDCGEVSNIKSVIARENLEHKISLQIISPPHFSFLLSSLKMLRKEYAQYLLLNMSDESPGVAAIVDPSKFANFKQFYFYIVAEMTQQILRLAARSAHVTLAKELLDEITSCLTLSSDQSTRRDDVDDDLEAQAIQISLQKEQPAQHAEVRSVETSTSILPSVLLELGYLDLRSVTAPADGLEDDCLIETIRSFIDNFDHMITSNIYSPDADIRMKSAHCILEVISKILLKTNPYDPYWISYFSNPNCIMALRKNILSAAYVESMMQMNHPNLIGFGESKSDPMELMRSESDDLALAIALSQSQPGETQGVNELNPLVYPVVARLVYAPGTEAIMTAIEFLTKLTETTQIQLIGENWRRSDAMTWLILQLAKLNGNIARLFIIRELISGLVDVFLGDQSEFCDVLYDKKSRKFCGVSSYCFVYPIKASGELCAAAKNLPDWSDLLETISFLLLQLVFHDDWRIFVSDWDRKSFKNKTFMSTCLRQSRYSSKLVSVIHSVSRNDEIISTVVCEVLFEALSTFITEALGHLFEVVDAFLSITDNYAIMRSTRLFSINQMSLFEILGPMKDQPVRSLFICTCIRSILFIASRNFILRDVLANPVTKLKSWAPWMMKFTFQLMNKLTKEHDQLQQQQLALLESTGGVTGTATSGDNSGTNVSPKKTKGPFVMVYGEPEGDREIPWCARAENTFDYLRTFLSNVGGNIDLLMPDDAFAIGSDAATYDDLPALVEAGTMDVAPGPDGVINLTGLSDGMTDEEFAQYLSNLD